MNLTKLSLSALAILSVSAFHAQASSLSVSVEEPVLSLECKHEPVQPDNDILVKVSEYQNQNRQVIEVSRSLFTGPTRDLYYTRTVDTKGRLGAPVMFRGPGIEFAINYTTPPYKDGRRIARLVLTQKSQDPEITQLICELK